MKKGFLSVVIPALDEPKSIGKVIASVRKSLARGRREFEIIVVDSSSDDRTLIAAKNAGADKVVKERTLGYGRAYMKGFALAKGPLLAMIDADGTYPAERLSELCDLFEGQGADVLQGSRFLGKMEECAMPFYIKFGNVLITLCTNLLFGTSLTDSQSGLRIIRKNKLLRISPKETGMTFASELNVLSKRNGLKVVEVPIEYRQRKGVSKLRPVQDGFSHFSYLFSEWAFPGGKSWKD